MPEITHRSSTDWRPTATIETLAARAKFTRSIRQLFDERGFIEVNTPCWFPETVVDAHLDPLQVRLDDEVCGYLQTSPEAGMKRLLAAGANAIYQLGPVFRGFEYGVHHNPEFTMLEWYRTGDSMHDGIDLLLDVAKVAVPYFTPQRISYQQLFIDQLGIDPLADADDTIRAAVETHAPDLVINGSEYRDDLLDVLMGLVIQPRLTGMVVVYQYPASQAALARLNDLDPRTAERFELFINAIEIANGYAELLDAEVLRVRTDQQNLIRRRFGKAPLPPPQRLLTAMEHGLPPCAGTALGFDRLVMLALGAAQIADVLPFAYLPGR